MVFAVVLQMIGAVLVCAAVGALAGWWFGILACGVVVFVAGYAHEHAGS